MNLGTPRIFIAATQQNVGKTTTALGLYGALSLKLGRIGFIKPIGQRFLEVEGKKVDEDSLLIRSTFDTQVPIEDMSPIAVEPDFTRKYIKHGNHETLVKRIWKSFDRAAWEKEFVIIEGTGHAGVGSVFDLSNAQVASLLKSKVILVTDGGIGKPIDEAALNRALFDRENVEVIGVAMNKVTPAKFEAVCDFAKRGFERLGLEFLGAMPSVPMLSLPTLEQIRQHIRGTFVGGISSELRRIRKIAIAAATSSNLIQRLVADTLVVVPGDREDVIFAAMSLAESDPSLVAGLVLSDNLLPHERLIDLVQKARLPVIASPLESYQIANRLDSMTVKTLPGDREKIKQIRELFAKSISVDRIREKIAA